MQKGELSHSYELNDRVKKVVTNKWAWGLFVIFFFAYPILRSVQRELPADLPVLYKLPNYQLKNQFNASFGTNELKGRFYIANFFFTSCPTVCPRLMKDMQKIQHRVRGLGDSVALVSFTVDPENDQPKILLKEAKELKAKPNAWFFLTGETTQVRDIIVNGFKMAMGESEPLGEESSFYDIAHSEKLVLVDSRGQIRGFYPSDTDGINKLMIDLGLLINKELDQA